MTSADNADKRRVAVGLAVHTEEVRSEVALLVVSIGR